MRLPIALLTAGALLAPEFLPAQQAHAHHDNGVDLREWDVEWGGRSRDPYVGPDGKVWFVGQAGNYVAWFDPATEGFRRFEIEEGTHPHTVIVDDQGYAWYAGNRNGRIGRIDPNTGELRTFMTGDARDPHTMAFDGRGGIWFTSQGSNQIGRLDVATGNVELVAAAEQPSNPYGIVLDAQGNPWVALFRAGQSVRVDPNTMQVTSFRQGDEAARARRIEWTSDGMVWYGDEARGFLGRIDPRTGEVTEWQVPGGPEGRPYALTKDDQDRLWFSETGPQKRLIGFDPRTEQFFSINDVSHNIRHMMFDARTGAMWFGTDADKVGRLIVSNIPS